MNSPITISGYDDYTGSMKMRIAGLVLLLCLFFITPGLAQSGVPIQSPDDVTVSQYLTNISNITNSTSVPTPMMTPQATQVTPTLTQEPSPETTFVPQEPQTPIIEPFPSETIIITTTPTPTQEPSPETTFVPQEPQTPIIEPFPTETIIITTTPTPTQELSPETTIVPQEPQTPTIEPFPTETITITITPTPTQEPSPESTIGPQEQQTLPIEVIITEASDLPSLMLTPNLIESAGDDDAMLPLAVSGNFSFLSVPTGGSLIFNGIDAGITPVILNVDETAVTPHTVTIKKAGYQDWTTTIDHNPAPGTTETITATMLPALQNGSILVTSEPAGATLALDGGDIRTTPYTYTDVEAGSHTITISKDGYSPFTTTITVSPGAQSVVSASLTPVSTTGSLTVESYPPGAIIFLDGIVYGVTPASFQGIQAGTHNLKLAKHGYQTISKSIEIEAGQVNTVQVPLPWKIPVYGTLSIQSYPSGGVITIDGVQRGITPARITGLKGDSYNVRVSIPGYLSWIGIIHVQAGRETTIYATLTPKGMIQQTGTINILSNPSGASVLLDSRPQGKTPLTLRNVASGLHPVVIAFPGYDPVYATVQVTAGKTSEYSVQLTPYQMPNLTPGLISLSDDAATYLLSYGRLRALNDFEKEESGFSRDNRYIMAVDLDGVVVSHAADPGLVGTNLSEPVNDNPVQTGSLITSLARAGGGVLYDTRISDKDPAFVSLIYVRPAIRGVIIATHTAAEGIPLPVIPATTGTMKDTVQAAVNDAQGISREQAESDILDGISADQGILLHSFDLIATDDGDYNGVSMSQVLTAAAESGGGFVWIPIMNGEDQTISLTLAYVKKVDDTWGIWATTVEKDREVIIMMDTVPISI